MDEALSYFFGQFEKIRCLHKTERSEVWLCTDATGRPVIYKRIHRTCLPLLEKLQELAHPLWPEIYTFIERAGETHLLEEYVQGEPMTRRLKEACYLTEREARDLLLELADGLAALHAAGILHRDIKPGNLIESHGMKTVRLIDFDVAREMHDGAPDTTYLGTRGYAPPEQYGYAATDARSDIFALGKTVHELLGPAYHGSLTRILERATEMDPKHRYQSINELVRDVRYGRFVRRARCFAASFAVLVVAAAIYVLYLAGTHPGKIEELEETPVEELVRHPEELTPDTSREDVKKKEQEQQAPPGRVTVQQVDGGTGSGMQENEKAATPQNPATEPPATGNIAPRKGEIRAHYSHDGFVFNGWTDAYDTPIDNAMGLLNIPPGAWKTWAGDDTIRFFPDDWVIHASVSNTTDETYAAPTLSMTYNDGVTTTARTYEAPPLVPGGSIDFDIPLAGLAIANPTDTTARTMHLELHGIDHVIFGSYIDIDFVPEAGAAHHIDADGNWR
ncbi:serine/threonine-protein kinase [uncultured Selenomonas sp.]|uniref:serine/threonine protein kinase n=1 Tax=uncultured Selenomonas sp. TaxID=159275 RepID=UPI0025D288D5|nr:serine/threonine-protein kinase [uncultured Selenomonas sp.]